MLQAEAMFKWTHRLFGIGLLLLIALGVIEANFGSLDQSFMRTALAAGILIGMILLPTLVLTGYFLVVCSLAIYALAKVLRTNWRLRRT